MRIASRILVVLAVLGLLVAGLWFGGRFYLSRSVAQNEGTIVTDVAAPVEIAFDAKGIPRVWAKSDGDAFFAVGWLHASERLFQMELVRRLARGELSELFGEAAYETDVKQRRLGFARRARADDLSPRARAALQRYADGVNAWVAQASPLPPELVILRVKPRRWTVEDSLAISFYQTWYSHQLQDRDLQYQKLIETLGLPGEALTRAAHPWSPPTVPDSFVEEVLGATGMRATAASNTWTISPTRSASGAALHASDPHLAIDQVPGLWYLAGVHSEEGLDIVGVTYAGGPFVVMGHNGVIAFSFTVAAVDLIDYYYDDPANASQVILEEIAVKGEKSPRRLEVRLTPRGVMIDETTSLHWAGFDFPPADLIEGGLDLQKARTFEEFRRAVTRFGALDANWMFSDGDGNIGYQLGAPLPIRDFDTYARQQASDPGSAWKGYRPLEETPHALNPDQGFLVSSNNQIVSENWPYAIPGFYDPYRITRAMSLLPEVRTAAESHAMQVDLVSAIALRWKSLAADGARAAGLNGEAQLLSAWDGRMSADSKAATLFSAWWRILPRAIFEDELGDEWAAGRAVLDETLTLRSPVIDDRRTEAVETITDMAARAMREAVEVANGRAWGEASTLTVRHPLARVKLLDRWLRLDRGPLPSEGDAGTLNANFFSFDEVSGSFPSRVGASMRFVLDWSDIDAFTLTGALGQSGNPFSPHYDDFLPLMRSGEAWIVPFSREKAGARQASLLRLVPSGDRTRPDGGVVQ